MNFWPVLPRNLKIFGFYWPNHRRQIFVVQIPNLSVFGLFEVFLNDKRAFGLVGQPLQPAQKKFRPLKLKCRFLKVFIQDFKGKYIFRFFGPFLAS